MVINISNPGSSGTIVLDILGLLWQCVCLQASIRGNRTHLNCPSTMGLTLCIFHSVMKLATINKVFANVSMVFVVVQAVE